jgi:hypothetical protein
MIADCRLPIANCQLPIVTSDCDRSCAKSRQPLRKSAIGNRQLAMKSIGNRPIGNQQSAND